nr:MAG TPA: hypothetical protein [Caudoviricetes sp.]
MYRIVKKRGSSPCGINIAKLNACRRMTVLPQGSKRSSWVTRMRLYSQFQHPIMIGTSYSMHYSLKKPI